MNIVSWANTTMEYRAACALDARSAVRRPLRRRPAG